MRKLRQWTIKHPLQFVVVFMLVYFTWFSLLEKYAKPVLTIHSKNDHLSGHLYIDPEWIEPETGDYQYQYFIKTGGDDLVSGYSNECLSIHSCIQ